MGPANDYWPARLGGTVNRRVRGAHVRPAEKERERGAGFAAEGGCSSVPPIYAHLSFFLSLSLVLSLVRLYLHCQPSKLCVGQSKNIESRRG